MFERRKGGEGETERQKEDEGIEIQKGDAEGIGKQKEGREVYLRSELEMKPEALDLFLEHLKEERS